MNMPAKHPYAVCKILLAIGWLAAGLGTVGCSESLGTATGNASYNGQPIERGAITFTPSDGVGPIVGGEITQGAYTVRDIPPGPKTVRVEGFKDVNFASSSQEMMDRAAEARSRGDNSGLVDPADLVPPNAEGNNQPAEVKAGRNELNFQLQPPKPK